jgi:D-aminopeptidase
VVIAFSAGYRIPDRPSAPILARDTLANEQAAVTVLGQAVVEAVEEAVLNSLFMAETMVGRDGNTRHGLPVAEVVELVRKGLGAGG